MPNQIAFYPQSSGGGSGSVTNISNQTLATAAASVTFSSIPQTYGSLMVVFSAAASTGSNMQMIINGDASADYSYAFSFNNGGNLNLAAASATATGLVAPMPALGVAGQILIPFYAATTLTFKQVTQTSSANSAGVISPSTGALNWASSAAIASFTLQPTSGTFSAGSTFTLYGLS